MDKIIKRKREVKSAYTKWNHEEKTKLIHTRIKYDGMFTGKNACQRDGWKKISEELGKSSALCRQQWQSLIRKYKSLTQKSSGSGMGDEATEGDVGSHINWPYFDIIRKYASTKDNFNPPHLSCNIDGIVSLPDALDSSDEEMAVDNESPGPSSDYSRSTPTSSSSDRSQSRTTKLDVEKALVKETKKITIKISAALTIFGQMVQQEFPNIDVSALLISESEDST